MMPITATDWNTSVTTRLNSILVGWLLLLMALVIGRLYRIRYQHRGARRILSADQLCHVLWLSLSRHRLIATGIAENAFRTASQLERVDTSVPMGLGNIQEPECPKRL